MFIPKGKALHENLATTYVLVDALVADLCEGGFSGIVEMVLRDTDAQILISSGKVVGVLEQRGLDGKTGALNRRLYQRATVPELAARARYERGRISIFACSGETALAAAGLAGAEQLYAELTTDFADLQKMISKLSRERERQWFIEMRLGDGSSALLHLKDDRCRVITLHPESGQHEIETAGIADNPALAALLETCAKVGGTFDVYFRGVDDDAKPVELVLPPPVEPETAKRAAEVEEAAPAQPPEPVVPQEVEKLRAAYSSVEAAAASGAATSASAEAADRDPIPQSAREIAEARLAALSREAGVDDPESKPVAEPVWQPVLADESLAEVFEEAEVLAAPPEPIPEPRKEEAKVSKDEAAAPQDKTGARKEEPAVTAPAQPAAGPRNTAGLSAIRSEVQAATDFAELTEAQIMNEVKRLGGEIARTIEDACRAIEQRDSFSIYLRAGQLKVADRYPFLDPFGAEFEYLSGEIAFIGSAAPWEFIEGLTEALKLAVQGVAQASTQGPRIRAQIAEDLQRLLEKNRAAFVEYGLDGSIDQIINA